MLNGPRYSETRTNKSISNTMHVRITSQRYVTVYRVDARILWAKSICKLIAVKSTDFYEKLRDVGRYLCFILRKVENCHILWGATIATQVVVRTLKQKLNERLLANTEHMFLERCHDNTTHHYCSMTGSRES
jgi:hypothetical protein